MARASAKRGGSTIAEPSRERTAHSGRIGAMPSVAMSAPVNTPDHAGHGLGGRGVDPANARMGVRRAHQHAGERAWKLDVGDEASAPEQEAAVLDAAQRRADALVVRAVSLQQIHTFVSRTRCNAKR